MTNVLFNGCSFTRGTGIANELNNPRLWTNQLSEQFFKNYKINNIATAGKNNHWIFVETMFELTQKSYDIVIVGWTDTNRLNFDIGLENYSTLSMLTDRSINLHSSQTVSGKWLNETGNRVRKYQNPHRGILDLIKYINILVDYQVKQKKSKIFFVNSLCYWPIDYFNYVEYTVPSELDHFYQEILEVDYRNDDQIKQLYDLIHSEYNKYGGIQSDYWLNLYNSLRSIQIDNASETDLHPGLKSQDLYSTYLAKQLKEKL